MNEPLRADHNLIFTADESRGILAEVYSISDRDDTAEIESYARLFAAAPEMLKALKLARKEWGAVHDIVSDLIESGALTEAMIPDDYQALVVALECASISADVKTGDAIEKATGKKS